MKVKTKETILVPPDGGWGWVILVSAVVVNVLIPGTVKSFGVLFVEFLHVFKASPTAASWMPALCYFLYSSLGPLSSVLSMKYSYKTVTIIGGTFAATGMMISYFATSVPYLYFSYGIMVGIGAGLTCPVSVYIVTDYFEKYRGFANGMCISGSCFGAMLLPLLLQYLLDTIGYRGAVLIMGAITLNSVLCGLLYHPVEQHMKRVLVTTEESGIDNKALILDDESPTDIKSDKTIKQSSIEPLERYRKISSPDYPISEKNSIADNYVKEIILEEKYKEKQNENDREDEEDNPKNEKSPQDLKDEPVSGDFVTFSQTQKSTSHSNSSINQENSVFTVSNERYSLPNIINKSTNPRSSVPKIFRRLCSNHISKPACKIDSFCLSKDIKSNDMNLSEVDLEKQEVEIVKNKKFFDLSILKDPIYLVILISNSTSAISNTNFMILLPSYAIDEGFDKNSSALLLSIVSALDLIGRVGGASLSDINFIPKYYYFVGGLGMSGVSLALLPMATSYRMLSFFCGLFGISSGTYIGITTVVLADMLGAERLSSSYGIALFVNGVLQLLGPPLIGIIYEQIGSYKPIFLALGIILILGTSLWAIVPIVKRRKEKEVEVN